MDQVKSFARAAAKHIFWIGCGVILAVSVGTWFFATDTLEVEFDENAGKINSKFQNVSQLKSKTNPPTDQSHAEMDKLLDATLQKVVSAWHKQYSYQENILVWDPRLKPDFVSKVRPLKPIELKVEFPAEVDQEILNQDLRQRYATYVDNLLPVLAEVIGTDWRVGVERRVVPGMATAGPRGAPVEERKPPLVVWDEKDQQRLVGAHFNWSSQSDIPTTIQVLYAQEDLWVYTALMYIIAQTNDKIESRHEAVVKTIETILIGRGAIGRSGQVTRLTGTAMGGAYGSGEYGYGEGEYGEEYGEEEEMGSFGGDMGGGMMGDMGSGYGTGMGSYGEESSDDYESGMASATVSRDPAEHRYVDNNYLPLSATRLREALRSGSPDDAFLVVAKRMPVRLRLVVDQRKIPKLLAAFGNSRLPVEVRQVRVNRQGGSTGLGGGYEGGYGGGYGSGYGGGEMMGLEGMSGGGMGYGGEYESGGGYSSGYGGDEEGGYEEGGYEEGGGYSSGYGGDEEGGYGGDSMFGGGGYGAGGYGMRGVRGRTEVSSTSKYDVPVEIYGIIYIYNPVDEQQLGMDQDATLTGAVGSTATPAS